MRRYAALLLVATMLAVVAASASSARLPSRGLLPIAPIVQASAKAALGNQVELESQQDDNPNPLEEVSGFDKLIASHTRQLARVGRQIFRFDTFGSEEFRGDSLRLHEALATLSPAAALAVGLKVDATTSTTRPLVTKTTRLSSQ